MSSKKNQGKMDLSKFKITNTEKPKIHSASPSSTGLTVASNNTQPPLKATPILTNLSLSEANKPSSETILEQSVSKDVSKGQNPPTRIVGIKKTEKEIIDQINTQKEVIVSEIQKLGNTKTFVLEEMQKGSHDLVKLILEALEKDKAELRTLILQLQEQKKEPMPCNSNVDLEKIDKEITEIKSFLKQFHAPKEANKEQLKEAIVLNFIRDYEIRSGTKSAQTWSLKRIRVIFEEINRNYFPISEYNVESTIKEMIAEHFLIPIADKSNRLILTRKAFEVYKEKIESEFKKPIEDYIKSLLISDICYNKEHISAYLHKPKNAKK